MVRKMVIAHVYENDEMAYFHFSQRAWEYVGKITNIDKVNKSFEIGGDIHCFMGWHTYRRWCIGRIYVLNGAVLYSDYPVGGEMYGEYINHMAVDDSDDFNV